MGAMDAMDAMDACPAISHPMTAGMAFEALNHAGDVNADVLVILNDNDHSISENVGALHNYFAHYC